MDTDTIGEFLEDQGFSDESIDDFLEHFGVRGQKWGVRKNSAEKQAGRENKAKKFESKAKDYQGNIDRIDVRLARSKRRTPTTDNLRDQKEKFTKRKETALNNAEATRQGKLTSGKKKTLVVGSAAAAIAGTIATKMLVEKYKFVQVKNLRLTNQQFVSAKKLLDGKMKKRFDSLTQLSKMTTGDHPSRQGALREIQNLNEFYKVQLKKMADRHNITDNVLKKMDLGSFL